MHFYKNWQFLTMKPHCNYAVPHLDVIDPPPPPTPRHPSCLLKIFYFFYIFLFVALFLYFVLLCSPNFLWFHMAKSNLKQDVDDVRCLFNCYLAVPRPILGYSQGGSLTNLMLITAFQLFSLKGYRKPCDKGWVPKPGRGGTDVTLLTAP